MTRLVTSATPYLPVERTPSTLRAAAEQCRGCPLYANATHAVFGRGPPAAAILLVGEQPGDEEDRTGAPFVGPAGRVLDSALVAAGIERAQVYVTNVVKHFGWVPRGKRRMHKTPTQRSIDACMAWLEQEIELVGPRVLVCLGATAARALIDKRFKVTEQRGVPRATSWCLHTLATVHPSSILRAADADQRAAALASFVADLKVAADLSRENSIAAPREAKTPDAGR